MPDSPEDTSNSPLTRKSSPSITGSGGRGQLTPEGLTSETRSRQQEITSVTPQKRAPPRERSSKKAKRPDQQLYVPRRARQTNRSSSENPQSVKQTLDTRQADHRDCPKSERPVTGVGDFCNQADHNIDTSPRKVEADIFPSAETPSIQDQDQNNVSNKQRNDTVDHRIIDRDVDHCLPSVATDSKNTVLKGDRHKGESANECSESQCHLLLSEKVTPCGFQVGNPANDIVLGSSTASVSQTSLSHTPTLEQPQKVVCEGSLEDTRNSCSENQTAGGTQQSECYKVVAAQDQSPLPIKEIMAEDATRLESTGVSGSGDDETSRKPTGSVDKVTGDTRQEGGETDDGKKEEDEGEEEEEDSWDTMFDEEGNSLKEDEIKEITDAVGGVSVSVKKPAHDYYNFSPKDTTDYSKLEHVVEAYDFPADFKTEDLVMSFSAFKNKGFDVKWVDDTHALIVFATAQVAGDALGLQNPMLRTRPLSLASKQSKQKAKATVEFLQPYRPRPETSSVAARRMVSNALGVKSNVSKEQRAAEKQKLKEAKERKRDERRQKTDMWDGNI